MAIATDGRRSTPAALDDDVTLDRLVLDGYRLDARIASVVTAAQLERTIEGASTLTLTLFDPQRELLRSRLFSGPVDVYLDGLWFRLVRIGKAGDTLTLTFEDREVALLRRHRSYRKAKRSQMTRAEFAQLLVREVASIAFICPELHVRQPIAKRERVERTETRDERDRRRDQGIPDDAPIKIKGSRATAEQRGQIERAMTVAKRQRARVLPIRAMLCAGIGESSFRAVPNTEGAPHEGVFQANPANIPRHDTEEQARSFLRGGKGFQQGGAIHLARVNPDMGPGEIATRVEAGGKPASFYGQYADEADAIIDAWGGIPADLADSDAGRPRAYVFTRGQPGEPEDTWTALGRLADEVGWRRFMIAGDLYFIAEDDLFRSRPMMTLREDSDGVTEISWDVDAGMDAAEMTVQCRASRWAAPPGSVVLVEGQGIADGRWLVASIARSLFDRATSITLRQPLAELPEPAPETAAAAGGASGGASAASGERTPGRTAKIRDDGTAIAPADAPDAVAAIIVAGNRIIEKPYGHAAHAADRTVHSEYDCSSATAFALLGADLVREGSNYVSGTFMGMYRPGRGRWVTLYANSGHVFIEVAGIYLNTAHYGNVRPGGSGPRWSTTKQTSSGFGAFAVRHPADL